MGLKSFILPIIANIKTLFLFFVNTIIFLKTLLCAFFVYVFRVAVHYGVQ
jgi:hypothetical protein